MTDKNIINIDQADGVFARFGVDNAYQDNPVYDAAAVVILPFRSSKP